MYSNRICDALRSRRLVRFWYKDHLSPTTVEPYTYGENKGGRNALSAWLVAGETRDTSPPLWRMYLESEMRRVEVLTDEFLTNRPGYKPDDQRFQFIRCRVAQPRDT